MTDRWMVSVTLAGKRGEAEPYSGYGDDGAVTVVNTYGTSFTGIGPSPEEALAGALRSRTSALPHVEEVLAQLEDAAAGADEPISVGSNLMAATRDLLGVESVPPNLPSLSRERLVAWVADLRTAGSNNETPVHPRPPRRWTDERDGRVWNVRTRWGGGESMAVSAEVDLSKLPPAPPTFHLIEFMPTDGQGPLYRTSTGDDERKETEFTDEELRERLDRTK